MVKNHFRWDFVGLSTDTKPTPENSEKVTNGSTYYCSDTSKLYVWCDTQWYERKPLGGGGGGGGSYTAGNGIDITNDTISVDTDTIQEKLTAGTNITIADNTISATDTTYSAFVGTDGTAAGTAGLVPAPATTDAGKFLKADGTWGTAGGGSGVVTELTSADYNYPTSNPNSIALWELPAGLYYRDNSVAAYADVTRALTDGQNFIQVMKISGSNSTIINIMGTISNGNLGVPQLLQSFIVNSSGIIVDFGGALTTSNIKQATGTSTTNVMSQNATTSMVFADAGTNTKVQIGSNASATGGSSVSIGIDSKAEAVSATAVGRNTDAKAQSSTAVGYYAKTNSEGSLAIGESSVGGSSGADRRTVAIGSNASAGLQGSIAIGAYSYAASVGEMNIGAFNQPTYGYNNTAYRLLRGVYDGQDLHDAATVAQGNTLATSAPTTATVGVLGQLYTDTTNMHTYQCTAIDTTDPSNPSYTWTQRW